MPSTLTVANVIDNAVTDFKNTFSANPSLITNGQFQVTDATIIAVNKRVQDEFTMVGAVDPDVRAAFIRFQANPWVQSTADAVLATIKQKSLEATFPETVKVFSPDPTAQVSVNSVYNAIWNNNAIPPAPTILNPTAEKHRAANAKSWIGVTNPRFTWGGSSSTRSGRRSPPTRRIIPPDRSRMPN
jgi:hypothetical protein